MAIKSKHRTLIKATLAALIAYGSLSSVAQAQTWGEISSVEQTMLKPLQPTWEQLPPAQRQQWLARVNQLKNMNPEQLRNAQNRMGEWASLSGQQRMQVNQQLKNDDNNNAKTRAKTWDKYIDKK